MACPVKSSPISTMVTWPGWLFFIFLILMSFAAYYAWDNFLRDWWTQMTSSAWSAQWSARMLEVCLSRADTFTIALPTGNFCRYLLPFSASLSNREFLRVFLLPFFSSVYSPRHTFYIWESRVGTHANFFRLIIYFLKYALKYFI